MSWTYSGNPYTSQRDELRFLVGDTNPDEPIMTDEEIDYLIGTYGKNPNLLRYYLFLAMATNFAREIKRSLGPQSEDPTKRLEYFKAQADYYQTLTNAAGVANTNYAYPKIFRKGMQSNPPWPKPRGKCRDYIV